MNDEIITLVKIINHQSKVSKLLRDIALELEKRASSHDASKFELDEFEGFCQLDRNRNQQKEKYGSKSYEDGIKNIDAVKLHQSRNSHHPEYYLNGIKGMNLVDVIEMLCDWEVARQQRDTEQDIEKTWLMRQKRFNLSDNELYFLRTIWEKM